MKPRYYLTGNKQWWPLHGVSHAQRGIYQREDRLWWPVGEWAYELKRHTEEKCEESS